MSERIGFHFLETNERSKALAFATRLEEARLKILAEILSFTSERQRLAYQLTFHPFRHFAVLGEAEGLLRELLRYKGVVLNSVLEDRLIAQASGDPARRAVVDQLRSAKQRLTHLLLEVPGDLSSDARERREAEKSKLMAEVEQLEGTLARQVAGLGRARRALSLTVEQAQKATPKQAVLLELLRYSHYLGTNKFEPRYGAIVLASSGKPKWVPLGSAEAIEKNIALYQAAVRVGQASQLSAGSGASLPRHPRESQIVIQNPKCRAARCRPTGKDAAHSRVILHPAPGPVSAALGAD